MKYKNIFLDTFHCWQNMLVAVTNSSFGLPQSLRPSHLLVILLNHSSAQVDVE